MGKWRASAVPAQLAREGNQRHRISATDRRDHPRPAPATRRGAGDAEFQRHFLAFGCPSQPAQYRAMLQAFWQMQQQIQHPPTTRGTRQQFCLAQPGQAFNRRQKPCEGGLGAVGLFGAG